MPNTEQTSAARSSKAEAKEYIAQPSAPARLWWLVSHAFVAAYEDNCFGIAKGAAYSALLSLFPVLTSLAAILVQVKADEVAHIISRFLFAVVPPGTEDLIRDHFRFQGKRPLSLLIGATLLSIWAASGAMMSLLEGFQAAYRIPSGRPWLKQRGMAIFLVLVVALPAIGASSLIVFGSRTENMILHWFGFSPESLEIRGPVAWFGSTMRLVMSFGTIVFVTGLLYYFGPNHRPERPRTSGTAPSRFWRVWQGALFSTVLWFLATQAFAWYVQRIANYNTLYKGLGGVIALLVWLYVVAVIVLVGCEYNAERERIDSMASLH